MEIPHALRQAFEEQLINIQQEKIIEDAQTISLRYRTQSGKGERLLTEESEALAYAAARMPATFAAVSTAFKNTIPSFEYIPQTLIDVGAGTGAASWAADAKIDLKNITCLEREQAMISIGKKLMQNGSKTLQDAKWITYDLIKDEIPEKGDLVIASYVLNELTDDVRKNVIKKLWDAANMMLILVEPGTPAGFSHLKDARQLLIDYGAEMAGPCPHVNNCTKTEKDWCHFTVRVSRSRLHRQLKGGEAPFEDEKFIYMAFMRNGIKSPNARVLRHPQIRSGYVMLEICTADGIRNIKLSKKDGEKYKKARKLSAGDEIEY